MVLLSVGLSNPAISLGLCESIYTTHQLVLSKGYASPLGETEQQYTFTHDPAFLGMKLYAQTLAPAGLPGGWALSQGVEQEYPPLPTVSRAVAHGLAFSATGWPDTVYLYANRAVITRFSN
jgi:hypothetical protein